MSDIDKSKKIINKYMLSYSAIDDWIYKHSINDDHRELDDDMKNIVTMIKTIAVYLGVDLK